MKVRFLYRDRGDHISFRDASEYVFDPKDLVDGKPHPKFRPQVSIEKDPEEVEFDHVPTAEELLKAFPERKADESQNQS